MKLKINQITRGECKMLNEANPGGLMKCSVGGHHTSGSIMYGGKKYIWKMPKWDSCLYWKFLLTNIVIPTYIPYSQPLVPQPSSLYEVQTIKVEFFIHFPHFLPCLVSPLEAFFPLFLFDRTPLKARFFNNLSAWGTLLWPLCIKELILH